MKKILILSILFSFYFIYSSNIVPNEEKEQVSCQTIYMTNSSSINKNMKLQSSSNSLPISSLTGDLMKNYFFQLNFNIGYNAFGSCGLVGIGMLLSYYDTFWDDALISECYDKSENLSKLTTQLIFENSPGIVGDKESFLNHYNQKVEVCGQYNFKDYKDFVEKNSLTYFHTYLLDTALNLKYIDVIYTLSGFSLGMTFTQINNLLDNYLDWFCDTASVESNFKKGTSAKAYAIDMIQKGVPVLMGISDFAGNGHVVVAYDYNKESDEIYFNSGLEDYGTYSCLSYMGYDSFDFAITLKSLNGHECSDNIYYQNEYFCVCDFCSIYPTHKHNYRLFKKYNLQKHYEICLCNASHLNVHLINTKNFIRNNGRLYSNCVYCLQLLEINLNGPIEGILSLLVPIELKKERGIK